MIEKVIKPMLALAAIAVSLSSVHAELIDSSKTSIMTEAQASAYYDEAINFSPSSIHWTVKPKFILSDNVLKSTQPSKRYSVTVMAEVDKQGNIVKSSIVQRSGNSRIDRATIIALRNAKLKPFMKNGIAVRGLITLPVEYVITESE